MRDTLTPITEKDKRQPERELERKSKIERKIVVKHVIYGNTGTGSVQAFRTTQWNIGRADTQRITWW